MEIILSNGGAAMAIGLPAFRRGDTYTIRIRHPDSLDITGWEFYLTLKSSLADLTPVAQAYTMAGMHPDDDAAHGLAYLEIPSDTSAAIPAGEYYYDVQMVIPGAPPKIRTIMPPVERYQEKMKVVPGVTD